MREFLRGDVDLSRKMGTSVSRERSRGPLRFLVTWK